MGAYTTVEKVKAYSLLDIDEDDSNLEKIIRQAEKDVDRASGVHPVNTEGRKFVPKELPGFERSVLSDAVCAQVEYRLQMGEEFFIQAQPESVRGDDTNYDGRLPRLGPKAREELLRGGLIRAGARASRGRRRGYPDWAERPMSQDTSNMWSGEFPG